MAGAQVRERTRTAKLGVLVFVTGGDNDRFFRVYRDERSDRRNGFRGELVGADARSVQP